MDCIFCKIITKQIPGKIISETPTVITILSLQNHPLVIPKKHIENIYEMDEPTGADVMKETIRVAKAVKIGLNADGVNLIQNNEVAAGQEVMHFHMHIKPRFKSDQVKLHFPTEDIKEETKKTTLEKIQSALKND